MFGGASIRWSVAVVSSLVSSNSEVSLLFWKSERDLIGLQGEIINAGFNMSPFHVKIGKIRSSGFGVSTDQDHSGGMRARNRPWLGLRRMFVVVPLHTVEFSKCRCPLFETEIGFILMTITKLMSLSSTRRCNLPRLYEV